MDEIIQSFFAFFNCRLWRKSVGQISPQNTIVFSRTEREPRISSFEFCTLLKCLFNPEINTVGIFAKTKVHAQIHFFFLIELEAQAKAVGFFGVSDL